MMGQVVGRQAQTSGCSQISVRARTRVDTHLDGAVDPADRDKRKRRMLLKY